MIFTFWEGQMPAYIKLCLQTWKMPYVMLNYDNLKNYTDFDIESTKRFTLPQIADAVRVHVLRDHGGYWMDADTIMIGDKLPEETILGNDITRSNTIGFLHAEKSHEDMFEKWAEYQDRIIADESFDSRWDVLGNRFTDAYFFNHRDIKIGQIETRWAETYKTPQRWNRNTQYQVFYFETYFHLSDIQETDLLMLHNSWTPDWYRCMSVESIMKDRCTMSNILREVV